MACNSRRPFVAGIFGQVPYFAARCRGRARSKGALSDHCWVDCRHLSVIGNKYGCTAGLMAPPEGA
jgi:hypothetical protein